ncbi:serine hydrolase domain-containing protein [[Empedobacter] haloabium]|uniref:Serine hydrolase domain-containing protein n=1 Tax=[Empedobacter] haloabium TaxID=592317 RepID=A0ABZ1UNS3_9BURK
MLRNTIGALCIAALQAACGGDDTPSPSSIQQSFLRAEAERVRAAAGLPGVAVLTAGANHVDVAISGVRRVGAAAPLLTADPLQAGSQTKAVTAMLLARLVEQGRLRWDSTLAELLPAWRDEMQPALRDVTVTQLLRHRGGFKRDPDEADAAAVLPRATGDLVADRALLLRHLLRQEPGATPGTYAYSNVGYMVAGLVAEIAGGAPFETLVQREVFRPLGVQATFGFPEDAEPVTVAGHERRDGAWRHADYPAVDRYNMARVEAAAGGMSIAMPEYAKLLREHLRGLQGASTFLRQETWQLIHAGDGGDYGFGWSIAEVRGKGRVSAHAGSWGSYYMFALLVPEQDRAVAVACNCYGDEAVEQLDRLARQLALDEPR